MADIYSLLKIDRNALRGFPLQANRVENLQTERNLRQRLRTLRQIEEKSMADGGPVVSRRSLMEVMAKVTAAAHTEGRLTEWTARDLRIVAYYLVKLQNDETAFLYALKILNEGWRNLFLNGLAFFLLNSWCNIKPELRRMTCRLFTNRLIQYDGSNRRVLAWKNHANYFDEAGPLRLLQLLFLQNTDITLAPSVMGYKESALSQSYYSDVIIEYSRQKNPGLDKLEAIFAIHNLARTKKLILAERVEEADRRGDMEAQTYLSNFVNKTLGDVTLAATWAPFPGATNYEAQKLKRAMQLAKKWFARKIIETFFKICVQDKQREHFWLQYVNHISAFRIVGSALTRMALQSDPGTRDMFMPFFIETNSRSGQTSALVLSIKNKVMIEFSDVGCLYVYKQDDVMVSFLREGRRRLASISDLKMPSMDWLIPSDYWGNYSFYKEGGKMKHQGEWTNRLARWMRTVVLTDANTAVSFFDSKDEARFTAQPYSDE